MVPGRPGEGSRPGKGREAKHRGAFWWNPSFHPTCGELWSTRQRLWASGVPGQSVTDYRLERVPVRLFQCSMAIQWIGSRWELLAGKHAAACCMGGCAIWEKEPQGSGWAPTVCALRMYIQELNLRRKDSSLYPPLYWSLNEHLGERVKSVVL